MKTITVIALTMILALEAFSQTNTPIAEGGYTFRSQPPSDAVCVVVDCASNTVTGAHFHPTNIVVFDKTCTVQIGEGAPMAIDEIERNAQKADQLDKLPEQIVRQRRQDFAEGSAMAWIALKENPNLNISQTAERAMAIESKNESK